MPWIAIERRSRLADALMGAAAGVVGTWAMDRAWTVLARIGSAETRRREQLAAQAAGPPVTVNTAAALARLAHVDLPDDRRGLAGQIIHHSTGALWGAVLGALHRELSRPAILVGCSFGAILWLVEDEGLVTLLGLAAPPRAYPPSTHAKALAAHLVYGGATDGAYRLVARAFARDRVRLRT
jgi:hypothetical protein